MCPQLGFNLLLLGVVILVVIYSYKRQIANARINSEIVSGFLQGANKLYGFFNINFTLEGYYKGRKAGYVYAISSEAQNPYCSLYVEPKFVSLIKKQPVFALRYPMPTPNTTLKGNRVYYSKYRLFAKFTWGGLNVFDREQVRNVLEELTLAAEAVEKQK